MRWILTVFLHLVHHMKVDTENTHQADANDEEHAHDYQHEDVEGDDSNGGFDEHEDVKDDVIQAYMQAHKKSSSGYNQAEGDAALVKLFWVDDEDDDHNAESPIDPIDQLVYFMDAL